MTKGKEIPFNQVSDQDTSIAMFTEGDHSTLDDGEAQRPSAIEMTNSDPRAPEFSYAGQYHNAANYPHHLLQRHYQQHQQVGAYAAAPLPYHTNLVPRYNQSVYSVPSVYPVQAYHQPQHPTPPAYPPQAFHHAPQPDAQTNQQQQAQQQQTPLAYSPHLHTAYHPTVQLQHQANVQQHPPVHTNDTFEAFLDPLPIDKPAATSVHVFCPHCKQHTNTKVKSAPIILFIVLLVLLLGPFIGAIASVILYKMGYLVRHVHSCDKCGQRLSKGCGFKSKTPRPTVRLAVAGWTPN